MHVDAKQIDGKLIQCMNFDKTLYFQNIYQIGIVFLTNKQFYAPYLQYNTIQYNTIQYNTIQYNTIL